VKANLEMFTGQSIFKVRNFTQLKSSIKPE
jgi:hypothetical protein